MTSLSNLPSSSVRPKKRLGRGYGSGKGGHTSSRGQKGQKSRGRIAIWFEGGQLPLIRRTPFVKGKLRNKSFKPQPYTIKLDALNSFKENGFVTLETLAETLSMDLKQLKYYGAKILSKGELTKKLTVKVPASKAAIKAIEKAGGSVQL